MKNLNSMKNVTLCSRESEVLDASRENRWDDELITHRDSCSACAETLFIAEMLQENALEASADSVLPDPGPIWWKAQLLARQRALHRADKPIALAERAGQFAGIAVGGVLLIWSWPVIAGWLSGVFSMFTKITLLGSILQSNILLVTSLALLPLLFVASILIAARVEE